MPNQHQFIQLPVASQKPVESSSFAEGKIVNVSGTTTLDLNLSEWFRVFW
jgi:hypothetical protein